MTSISRAAAFALVAALGYAHASATPADRQAVIEAGVPELQACWADIADQHPGVAGTLMFTVDLRRNGIVDWVDIEVDEIGAPKLAACAVRRIKKWRFPAGKRQSIGFGVGFVADRQISTSGSGTGAPP